MNTCFYLLWQVNVEPQKISICLRAEMICVEKDELQLDVDPS